MAFGYGRFRKVHQIRFISSDHGNGGGAVIPTLFGYLKDISDIQKAYWICLPCFLFILYYGVAGYKIRTK